MGKASVPFEEVKEEMMKDEEFKAEYEKLERSSMGITVKYKSNDPGTEVMSLAFLFHDKPAVLSWHSATKTTDGDVTTLTGYNLRLCTGEPITKELLEGALLNGGLWFDGNKKIYGSTLELISAEFFGVGDDRCNCQVSVISRLGGKA